MNKHYEIKPVKTNKQLVKQPKLSEEQVLMKLGGSALLIGRSGSGKTTLLQNLLINKQFMGGAFAKTFLFTSTAQDDILDDLDIPPSCCFTLEEAPDALQKIQEHQEKMILNHGEKANQYCLIFDDCIGNNKFLKSPQFTKCFIASRHFFCSVFLCSQHLRSIPKRCRLQAIWIALYPCSAAEMDTMYEEFGAPNQRKNGFFRMLNHCWGPEPFSFMSINTKAPLEIRYRKNLAMAINLADFME